MRMNKDRGYFVHDTALVETTDIGDGTRVWAFAHVMPGARIGRDCNIGDHCFIESHVAIGDNVTIKNGVSVWEHVNIADNVFLGPNVALTNDRFPRSRDASWEPVPTWLEEGVSVGANATIVCGVRIGRRALVGAGSVVTRDVPAQALVYGNPAARHGWVCVCGRLLEPRGARHRCVRCAREFVVAGTAVLEAPADSAGDQ